jgi:CRP-like cAMP-binding protein
MADLFRLSRHLRQLDLFQELSEPDLERLATAFQSQIFQPGQPIPGPARPVERVYIVLDGTVRLFHLGRDGREVTADLIGRDQLFGIWTLFGRPADGPLAEAVTRVKVCGVEIDCFTRLLAEWPRVRFKVAIQVACHLLHVEERLDWIASAGARGRLAGTLGRLAEATGRRRADGGLEIRPAMTHQELAQQIGLSRETVTRHLAGLEADGYIRREGRLMIVYDLARLVALAGEHQAPNGVNQIVVRAG